MTPTERKYRIIGGLASYPFTAFTVVLAVVLLNNLPVVMVLGVGVVIGLIGTGAGVALGSEVYARHQRRDGWPL